MASAPRASSRPPSRAPELQDPLNRWLYHPLSARLARALEPTGVSPNAVSVAGALVVWGAAWAYAALAWPLGAWLGLALHMLWHVVDGADGDLARLRGGGSPFGELIDGLSDYAGHAVLYVVLAALLDDRLGLWAWPLAAFAALSHSVQANHSESQRRAYLWWVHGVPWLRQAAGRGVGAKLARPYLAAAGAMTPHLARLDALVEAAKDDPARLARLRALIGAQAAGSLRYQKLLGANPRALLLGASMIATAGPLWFFLAEALLLNALLAASLLHHRAIAARIAHAWERGGPTGCGERENGGRGKD